MALPGLGRNSVGATSYGEDIPLGQEREIDGEKKYWSGQNYGFQSKESYQKLGDEGYFAGRTSGANPVHETLFGNESAQRVISSGKELVTNAVEAVTTEEQRGNFQKYLDTTMGLAGMAINNSPQLRSLMTTMGLVDKGFTEASKATNIGKPQLELVTDVLSGGAGTAKGAGTLGSLIPERQLQFSLAGATNGRAVTQDLMSGPMQITLKNSDNIPKGIGQGSAASPEWKPQVKAFFDRREKLRAQYEDLFRRGSSKVGKKLKQIYNDVSTGMSRDPAGNPEAYRGESTSKKFDKYREVSEAEPVYLEGDNAGKVKYKQQHHLFSKQESHAFVERMIELGDEDDVLALFIMAEDMDATMGGRLRNMLNMEDTPHNITHQSRIFDGREVKSKDMKALVSKAKTTDELMEMFRKYVTENVKPSIDEAKALDKLYKDLKFNDDQINMLRDKNMRS